MFFSVIIPTYNRAHLLSKAINSVLNQSFTDFELIIIDDGSTDNTKELVASYFNNKIRYIYQKNAERSEARNNGIKNATGDFICFLDSDDYFLTNRLKLLYNFLKTNNYKKGFYYTNLQIEVDNNLKKIDTPKPNESIIYKQILENNIFCQQTCISKEIIKQNLFNPNLSIGEDTELWLRIIKNNFPVLIENQYTVVVVEHDGRSINWRNSNNFLRQKESLEVIFHKNHSGLLIKDNIKKQMLSNCYFGIGKYYIWNNKKIKALTAILKSIFVQIKNPQTKYKINILFNIVFNVAKSKKLIVIKN